MSSTSRRIASIGARDHRTSNQLVTATTRTTSGRPMANSRPTSYTESFTEPSERASTMVTGPVGVSIVAVATTIRSSPTGLSTATSSGWPAPTSGGMPRTFGLAASTRPAAS
jgi:hypothetical protein